MSGAGAQSNHSPRNERGFALIIALFALVVIGATISGIFFAGRLEQQSGANTLYSLQAGAAADAGLNQGLVSLSPAVLQGLPVGGAALELGQLVLGSGLMVERQLSRLTGTLFLLRALGTRRNAAGGALATRAVGLLVQLHTDSVGGVMVTPIRQRAWVQLY